MNLKKLTNTIDFSLMFIGDLNQFNLLKTQLDTLLIVYKDTLSPKIINMVPAIENIENAMLIMTTYAISLDPGLNSVNGNEKFYKVVNAIFDHYNMSSPCNLVKTVTAASNGIYKEISNSNTCYIFFLGTVPIYTEQNYYEAILKWIKCNIISKQLRMNDPHRNLFQMILELSNASKSRIVKGRSEP
uniref:Uncharacterized protein n=1 Tax=Strongyloides venezuelensis TaxID=75913 RepID=A0A0K0FX92_STRVS